MLLIISTNRKCSCTVAAVPLDTLELLYQKSDILYHYFRHFGKNGDMRGVMEIKEMVSERIMHRLLDGFMPVDNVG